MINPTQVFDDVTTLFSTSIDLTYADVFIISFLGCVCANFIDNIIDTINGYIEKKQANK